MTDLTRNGDLRRIHTLKRAAGLDDDNYRALLQRATGQTSSADLDPAGRRAAIAALAGLPRRDRNSGRAQADSPAARKMRALWITAHQLGAIDDPGEHALAAFAKRQLQIDDLAWLPEREANRAIEALREICARAGWKPPPSVDPHVAMLGLIAALRQKLDAAIADLNARHEDVRRRIKCPGAWADTVIHEEIYRQEGDRRITLKTAQVKTLYAVAGALARARRRFEKRTAAVARLGAA